MAVALATLPLNRLADGEGEGLLATSAGLAGADLTGSAFAAAGLAGAACLAGALAAGLTGAGAFLATTFGAGLAGAFLTAVFFTATFFSTFLAGAFLAGAFFATTFLAGALGAGFLTAGFLAGDLAATFFADLTTFLAAAALTGAFFAAGLAEVLLAPFTARPLLAATVDLPVLTSFTLVEDLPFDALAAVELRVVFAISLHQFLAIAAACYSPKSRAPASLLLEYLHYYMPQVVPAT